MLFQFPRPPSAPATVRLLRGALKHIARKLDALHASLPRGSRAAFARYSRRYRRLLAQWSAAPDPAAALPFWLALPSLYHAHHLRESRAPIAITAFHCVLWAQFSLFLSVRLLDDLADDEASGAMLALVAGDAILEAENNASEIADADALLQIRGFLRSTLRAIPEAVRLQRSPRPGLDALLDVYRRGDALFKTAPFLLSHVHQRPEDFPALSVCCDHLAEASQMQDDLEDLAADLRAGRRNAMVALALRSDADFRRALSAGVPATLPRALAGRAIERIRGAYVNAALAAIPLGMPDLVLLLHGYAAALDSAARSARRVLRVGVRVVP
ncbi:MAG: hypothetical protein IPP94_04890 [Ignavibacteria bacterium]|nr:hypothetical protein [Ignavibacteria bacterium]